MENITFDQTEQQEEFADMFIDPSRSVGDAGIFGTLSVSPNKFLGDNRLKQGVAPEKVRETYEQALRLAEEAGLAEAVRPLVEIRLADLAERGGA